METSIILHSISAGVILIFKTSVLIVGYLVTRMGYNLLVSGITGKFNFKCDFTGLKADLASVSPGTLFLLLGIILMSLAVLKDKEFYTEAEQSNEPGLISNSSKPIIDVSAP